MNNRIASKNVGTIRILGGQANVHIIASSNDDITAELSGRDSEKLELSSKTTDDGVLEIVVLGKVKRQIHNSISLDIKVPSRQKQLQIKTETGSITIDKELYADTISLYSVNGEIISFASFCKGKFGIQDGKIKVYLKALSNVNLDFSASSGLIDVALSGVSKVNLSGQAVTNHKVTNRHRGMPGGFVADITYSIGYANLIIS